MAGETRGASAANRNKRRKLQDRSANKYYASNMVTTQRQPVGPQRPKTKGELPPKKKRPVLQGHAQTRSADVYYAAQAEAPTAQQKHLIAQNKRKEAKILPQTKAAETTVASARTVPLIDEICQRLRTGDEVIRYELDMAVIRRIRSALDLMVTREELTEDDYRRVVLVKKPSAAPAAELSVQTRPELPTLPPILEPQRLDLETEKVAEEPNEPVPVSVDSSLAEGQQEPESEEEDDDWLSGDPLTTPDDFLGKIDLSKPE